MKKLLIATAAMAVVAGAQAQSSVTIYGVLDASFTNTKTTTTAGVSSNVTAQSGTGVGQTGRLGLKGTEDLGGGLKAGFVLEGALNVNTGVLGTANASAANAASYGDTLFDRHAYVSVESAQYGTLKLGRTSDAVDSLDGYANHVQLFDTQTSGANGLSGKNANTTRYESPVIAGIQAIATYTSDAVKTDGTTNTGNTTSSFGATYTSGALSLGAASGKANVATSTQDGKTSTIYAGYNFGVADVRIQYTDDKAITESSNTDFVQFKTKEVSAAIPVAALGSGVTAIVHYETAEKSTQAGAATSGDYKQYGLVLAKALSKRTTLFAGYKNKNVEGDSDVVTTGFGLTHTF